jgi:hypothetical protein
VLSLSFALLALAGVSSFSSFSFCFSLLWHRQHKAKKEEEGGEERHQHPRGKKQTARRTHFLRRGRLLF